MWLHIGLLIGTFYTIYYFGIEKINTIFNVVKKTKMETYYVWGKQILTNKISKNIVEMHHRYYIINYPFGVSWYKIIIPRKRGPCLIDTITDGQEVDITKHIFTFMGPSYNFHGIDITPKLLGYEKLNFYFTSGEKRIFKDNEKIIVN